MRRGSLEFFSDRCVFQAFYSVADEISPGTISLTKPPPQNKNILHDIIWTLDNIRVTGVEIANID